MEDRGEGGRGTREEGKGGRGRKRDERGGRASGEDRVEKSPKNQS